MFASAPGYVSQTITGVVLENGVVTDLDIDLQPLVPFDLVGMVIDATSGEPLPGAQVLLSNVDFTLTAVSDASGNVTFPAFFAGAYDVTVGKWGWITNCQDDRALSASGPALVVSLEPTYYDDFAFDFGWTVASTADAGQWERGIPEGTFYNNAPSNPGADATGDCRDQAYVTGNGGGQAGSDDLDNGNTVLTSPLFDITGIWGAELRYHRWFYNAGGSGTPNDRMRISLDNGTNTVVIEEVTTSASAWVARSYRIEDFITPTSTMRLIVYITDDNPGHLVEGGFDLFSVVSSSTVGMDEASAEGSFRLWPNPSTGSFRIELEAGQEGSVVLMDAAGRTVAGPLRSQGGAIEMELALPAGIYVARVTTDSGVRSSRRVVITR